METLFGPVFRIWIPIGSKFKWVSGAGLPKVSTQKRKKIRNFMFEEFSVGMEVSQSLLVFKEV
jgi:hypothetical protein